MNEARTKGGLRAKGQGTSGTSLVFQNNYLSTCGHELTRQRTEEITHQT